MLYKKNISGNYDKKCTALFVMVGNPEWLYDDGFNSTETITIIMTVCLWLGTDTSTTNKRFTDGLLSVLSKYV